VLTLAKVFPNGWRQLKPDISLVNEMETLSLLEKELDDTYSVYHGVHWTNIEKHNYAIYGEIDFAVVGPSGKVLLIEQKNGTLIETDDGLQKKYSDNVKKIPFQIARNADGLQNRLKKSIKDHSIYVDSLLYCPDHKIKKIGTSGIDPDRIVDWNRKDQLVPIVKKILPPSEVNSLLRDELHQFLSDVLELVPEVNAIVGQTGRLYTKVSGGLSEWAQKIEFSPFRLRVIGTAGSGKTQLALSAFRESIKLGRKPLYICYNRSLADHISGIVPRGGEVSGYHQFGDRIAKLQGTPIDFKKPQPFLQMEKVLDNYVPTQDQMFDDLIVDEGQDFKNTWSVNLMRLLRSNSKVWWLEDPLQNIYSRDQISFENWVTIRSDANYRSPKSILYAINQILHLNPSITAASPIEGGEVELLEYTNESDLVTKTIQAIDRAVEIGFNKKLISLLTFRGRDKSLFTPFTQIGAHTLRASIKDAFDDAGNQQFTDGEITTDSVHRFKGQSCPCVILTEIDFEELSENVKSRIFVGATRATIKLILVISSSSLNKLLN
jgi:hypothetical protein